MASRKSQPQLAEFLTAQALGVRNFWVPEVLRLVVQHLVGPVLSAELQPLLRARLLVSGCRQTFTALNFGS